MYICLNLVYKLYFIGGKVVSNKGNSKAFEVGSNATLRWNLIGVPSRKSIYEIFYYKDDKKNRILSTSSRFSTENRILDYNLNNNPFEWNKISGNLNLNNGNGTLSINISNVQYNESGVFSLEFESLAGYNIKNNITLDVQSKFLSLQEVQCVIIYFVNYSKVIIHSRVQGALQIWICSNIYEGERHSALKSHKIN